MKLNKERSGFGSLRLSQWPNICYDNETRRPKVVCQHSFPDMLLGGILKRSIGKVSEMGEAPAMVGDNGLYLLMTRVLRSWSMGPGPTCTTNCCCPIYCNSFAMSWSGAHLCIPWLTCTIRSDGTKESCDCSLWMSLCGCTLQQLFPISPEF